MQRTKRMYIASLTGVFVATVAMACGGAASTAPTPTQPPSPTAVAQKPTPTSTPATVDATPAPTAPTPTPTSTPATVGATPAPTATQPPPTAGETAPEQAVFAWAIEEVDRGAKPALALTSADVLYVAYMLEARSGFVKNAVRSGSSWVISTLAEGYFYGPLDIAIGPDDVAHVSYHDHQDLQFQSNLGDAAYAVKDVEWSVTAVFDEGHDGWDNRIAIDAKGRPHISAIDPQDFDGNGVEYYYKDESGKWLVEGVGTGPLSYKYATSIAIDPQGSPHISYHDQKNKDLALASKDASGWTINVVDGDGETGMFSSMVIDIEGRFHISCFQKESSSSGAFKYATRNAADQTWEIRQVDRLDKLTFGFVGARNITSVAVDGGGNPWIAYSDEKNLKLARWDGSSWQIETVVNAGSATTLGQLVSLKLDSKDQPHIAYFEVSSKRPLDGVVKYAKGTPK